MAHFFQRFSRSRRITEFCTAPNTSSVCKLHLWFVSEILKRFTLISLLLHSNFINICWKCTYFNYFLQILYKHRNISESSWKLLGKSSYEQIFSDEVGVRGLRNIVVCELLTEELVGFDRREQPRRQDDSRELRPANHEYETKEHFPCVGLLPLQTSVFLYRF